jgi:hypothetical protein
LALRGDVRAGSDNAGSDAAVEKAFLRFDGSIGALTGGYRPILEAKGANVRITAARHKKTGESLILYADDILESAALIDLEAAMKNVLASHSVFAGGKIVVFARRGENAVILNRIIHKADPSLEVITVTQDELKKLKNPKDQENCQTEALIQYARSRGATNILALVKGPSSDPDSLAKVSERYKIPTVNVGFEKAIYSFSDAILQAMRISESQGRDGWLLILPPVRTITEDMQMQYFEYLRSLKALVAA